MERDEKIQQQVQTALRWQPELQAAQIGVAVSDGVVTLSGSVDQYGKKDAAEQVALTVRGVKAIVENIRVHRDNQRPPTDADILRAMYDACKWRWDIPVEQLRITVQDGWVHLEGEVAWYYQKEAVRSTAAGLLGVQGVRNTITVRPPEGHAVRVRDLEKALWRNRDIRDEDIHVEAVGGNIVLRGTVPSLAQKKEASRVAWNSPGATAVTNLLEVM